MILCIFLLGAQYITFGQAGELDTGFGDGGLVIQSIAPYHDDVSAMAIQPDGKIVCVGRSHTDLVSMDFDGFVTRHLPDGLLDSSFGENGMLQLDYGSASDAFSDVKVLNDGNILICGGSTVGSNYSALMVKLSANGSYDSSFGTNGIVNDTTNGNAGFIRMHIMGDGRILTSGSNQIAPALYMINSDGSFDSTFGTNGLVPINPQFQDLKYVNAIEDQQGKFIISGATGQGAEQDGVIMRFNSDGTWTSHLAYKDGLLLPQATSLIGHLI